MTGIQEFEPGEKRAEDLERGDLWVSGLMTKAQAELAMTHHAIKLEPIDWYQVNEGSQITFFPTGPVRREVKSSIPLVVAELTGGEVPAVISDDPMVVDSYAVYTDDRGYPRAALRSAVGTDGLYQEVKPHIDRLSTYHQVTIRDTTALSLASGM